MVLEQKEEITIDTCEEHGVWLDKGELEKIIRRIKERITKYQRRGLRRAKNTGRIQGTFLGWLSFLFD